jgi:hypothetical protein
VFKQNWRCKISQALFKKALVSAHMSEPPVIMAEKNLVYLVVILEENTKPCSFLGTWLLVFKKSM